ncbi:hypothetical protein EVAR_48766_1 [Eumeta japonica]|uniref:Uncharacterized protein n=1 Tax=Eumeta variegata TaxID=151549 RepID=A0A4C1Y5C0_EUMVA|nr:hypothetical protein EVAR_48766_1 [Eumeta japonica]
MNAGCTHEKSMTCRVPPEPSVRVKSRNERFLFHSIGRCVRVEERQRPHTTYTLDIYKSDDVQDKEREEITATNDVMSRDYAPPVCYSCAALYVRPRPPAAARRPLTFARNAVCVFMAAVHF